MRHSRDIAPLRAGLIPALTWSFALVVAGAWAAARAPVEWAPRVELPEVRVTAAWPGASPRAVERYVAAPIERALQAVPGTAGVASLSREDTHRRRNPSPSPAYPSGRVVPLFG